MPRIALLIQPAAAVLAIGALALWPPRAGAMMLVPLAGGQADAVNAGLAGGARLLGPGPVEGSVLVMGERDRLAAQAVAHAMLLFAAPDATCGGRA